MLVRMIYILNYRLKINFSIILFINFIFFNHSHSSDENYLTAIKLINDSEYTLNVMSKNKDLEKFNEYLKNSKALLIFPSVIEGGLFFGAKGGNGVLVVKNNNQWTGPFFFTIGGLSVGLQFGIKTGKMIMTIMSDRGLTSILKERVKFGVDLDVAVVNKGVGFSADSTLRLADIFSFSDNNGLFLGSSLEGSYIQPRNDYNNSLYKKNINPDDIINNKYLDENSRKLVETINTILN